MPNRAAILKQNFYNSIGLPLEQILSEATIETVLREHKVKYRQALYPPVVVIWAWLTQVLDPDKSLSNSVKRMIAWLAAAGVELPSGDTGAYSKARKRLPQGVLKSLLKLTTTAMQAEVPSEQYWCGRPVKAYDSTTVLASDTAANQQVYPQHSNQKPGCGFPIVRLVVWFCVTTGAVVEAVFAPLNTSEWQLSRQLYALLNPEDVVVADSAYGTYVDLILVRQAGADGVFRKHYRRRCDFCKGKRLGQDDHLVRWQRPNRCPASMDATEFAALPLEMSVREVRFEIRVSGFRPKAIILVTTLVDPKRYSKANLAALYQLRWQATEVNFKHLKTTMQMEMIMAKTPEMVQKELWVHLLGYTLLRKLMGQAAQQARVVPSQISLQGTRQQFNHFRPLLVHAGAKARFSLYNILLELISQQLVPLRPHRVEPRVVKRRPKPFPKMQQPRSVLKAKLLA
jgi:hypothetical protein